MKQEEEQIELFMFDFLNSEKGKSNSESIIYNRMAKGFGLCVLHYSAVEVLELLLYLICKAYHFEPAQSLHFTDLVTC